MAREVKEKVKVKGPKGQVGFCVLYTDGTIRIDWVRFSYPHLKKPYKGDDDKGEAKYGIVGLMPKKTHKEAHGLIADRIDDLMRENKVKALGDDKKFLRDGDKSDKEENEKMWLVSAREVRRPPLRNRDNSVVEPEDADEVFQGGYWGSILIRPWYQNNKFGKRVNAGLSSVQFLQKDETFGEGRLSEDDLDDTFEDHGDSDDGDDSYDEDADARPKRKRSSDDDDDKPARRRRASRDDDEEEERPARRRRASRDDDEEDDI